MDFVSTLQAILRLARVALAAILLVGVPLAEAATCGGEVASSGIEAAVGQATTVADNPAGDADHGRESGEAQHCIHGHCHHATAFKTVETANVVRLTTVAKTHTRETDFALSRVVVGLERPPKA